MSDVLAIFSILFFIAGVVEVCLFNFPSAWYYQFGPVSQREEWQSSVPCDIAHSTLDKMLHAGELFGCRRGECYCFRQQGWTWGPLPRSVLTVIDSQPGAFLMHEVRPFLGFLWWSLAVAGLIGIVGHPVLAGGAALVIVPYFHYTWRLNLDMWGRLRAVRRSLRSVGVYVCEHCGYDLHGLQPGTVCPECGRGSEGRYARVSIDRILRCVHRRAAIMRVQGFFNISAGALLLSIEIAILASLLWLAWHRLVGVPPPWTVFFVATGALVTIASFWTEIRTQGRYLEGEFDRATRDVRFHKGPALILLSGPFVTLVTECLLSGPRMILDGWAATTAGRSVRVSPDRAARMVSVLTESVRSIELDALRETGEPAESAAATARWLVSQGWVGITERGDRVYLFSESRDVLNSAV